MANTRSRDTGPLWPVSRHLSIVEHERPYLFSGPLVRALLAGTKTETRRVLRGSEDLVDQPGHGWVQAEGRVDGGGRKADRGRWLWCRGDEVRWAGPRWPLAGDSLWVREAWRAADSLVDGLEVERDPPQWIRYRADGAVLGRYDVNDPLTGPGDAAMTAALGEAPLPEKGWKPSIHMYRWASRITRKIVEMRVERLQDIDEAGALAEGIAMVPFRPDDGFPVCQGFMAGRDDDRSPLHTSARAAFEHLWDQINAPKPDKPVVTWEANPLVVVTVFEGPK